MRDSQAPLSPVVRAGNAGARTPYGYPIQTHHRFLQRRLRLRAAFRWPGECPRGRVGWLPAPLAGSDIAQG